VGAVASRSAQLNQPPDNVRMEVELDFESVRERWLAAGGIIGWFAPPIVERWIQSEIPAREVAELRSSAPNEGVDGPPSLAAATASATFGASSPRWASAGTPPGC
jgi:hypothetical protein